MMNFGDWKNKWGGMFGGGQTASTGTPPATQTPTATPQAALGLLTRPYTNPWANRGGAGMTGQQMGGFGSLSNGAGLGGFQAPSYGAQAGADRLASQGDYINTNGASGVGDAINRQRYSFNRQPQPGDVWTNSSGFAAQPGDVVQPGEGYWYYTQGGPDTGPGWAYELGPTNREGSQWTIPKASYLARAGFGP